MLIYKSSFGTRAKSPALSNNIAYQTQILSHPGDRSAQKLCQIAIFEFAGALHAPMAGSRLVRRNASAESSK